MQGFAYAKVYNFATMPTNVYVKLKGSEGACQIQAMRVEEEQGPEGKVLVIKDGQDKTVGKFDASLVAGWWVQFD
jgi:hypothetical protein